MTRNRTASLGLLGAGLGAFVAAAEGFSSLRFVSTPAILIVIAGAFGAGAGLATAMTGYRMAKQSGTGAEEDRGR